MTIVDPRGGTEAALNVMVRAPSNVQFVAPPAEVMGIVLPSTDTPTDVATASR